MLPRRLIRPSAVKWSQTILITLNGCLPHFLCGLRGEQLLASYFMALRSAFLGWIWVSICKSPPGRVGGGGDRKKGRESSTSVTQTPVCELAFRHHERQRGHPPRHKKSIFKQMSKGLSASYIRMLLPPPTHTKKNFRTCLMFLWNKNMHFYLLRS